MKTIITICLLAAVFFNLPGSIYSQEKVKIKGKVTDDLGRPLSFVNVYIEKSPDGAITSEDGTFSFFTRGKGRVMLTASMVGYGSWRKEIEINSKSDILETIELEEKAVSLKEAVITASSYGSEKEKGLVVSRLDVLTTPGGTADIYQALKTMPGLTQVSESAELYVRGGDPIETTTIIDQAVVYHTFTFESGFGGLFSNINQSVVKSLYFTSGGFSSKYGNALSGVLDIETRNIPERKNLNIGISMANISITAELPAIENKLGTYFDYRQSFTQPIFWLNGGMDRFTATPVSKNATGAIIYSYSDKGKIKLFGVYADDNEGVNVENAEYNGVFRGNSKNLLFNFQNSLIFSENMLMKNSFSYNRYSNEWRLGILDITKKDNVFNLRNDFEYIISSRSKILSGFEIEDRIIGYSGKIPSEDYDIRPEAGGKLIDSELMGTRLGFYSEYQAVSPLRLNGVTFSAGARFDQFRELKSEWIDPRLSLGYKLNDNSNIRLGWGIFHQIPDPRLFAPVDGNPSLKAMMATHYIASYEYILNEQNSFRVEIYHKKYENLPLKNNIINYDNSGYGFANGADIIFKGTLPFGINGWISYGYINTKRLWMDYTEYANSDYDITHSLTLVAKYDISTKFQIGINAKIATGKPFSPVEGSRFLPGINVYEPIYGKTNSERYPGYKRLDLRLTYFDQLFGKYRFVAFMEALNILNITNIFGFTYTPDYSERRNIKSYFGSRMLVFGISLDVD